MPTAPDTPDTGKPESSGESLGALAFFVFVGALIVLGLFLATAVVHGVVQGVELVWRST